MPEGIAPASSDRPAGHPTARPVRLMRITDFDKPVVRNPASSQSAWPRSDPWQAWSDINDDGQKISTAGFSVSDRGGAPVGSLR